MAFTCRFCGATGFASRTKLFAHVRGTKECSEAALDEDETAADMLAKGAKWKSVAIVFGYACNGEAAEESIKSAFTSAGAKDVETSRVSGHTKRGLTWRQEHSCAALCDVITVKCLSALSKEELVENALGEVLEKSDVRLGSDVHIFAGVHVNRAEAFDAEVACTERTYTYMLPLDVIINISEAGNNYHGPNVRCASNPHLRETYRSLKQIFRTALRPEGHMGPCVQHDCKNSANIDTTSTTSTERSWHNFCNGEMQSASFQGMLHKFQLSEPELLCGKFALVHLTASDFMTEQCRKLIAAVLCIHHGWLPVDFLLTATRADVHLSLPIAPAHLLYLECCRFYHWERRNGRLDCAVQGADSRCVPFIGDAERLAQWRRKLEVKFSELEYGTGDSAVGHCIQWLHHVKKNDVPRLCERLYQIRQADSLAQNGISLSPSILMSDNDCPPTYRETLQLLRDAAASGAWPDNKSRAGYIHGKGGGTLSIGRVGNGQRETKHTALFPKLTGAVFELEMEIAPPGRKPSTMVVINRNAQFKPHVDSGEGKGQSKTLIVGLGAYTGGELVIEGVAHNLKYKPLEFDGSKQRHWTLPFDGERFSLVFFSPSN